MILFIVFTGAAAVIPKMGASTVSSVTRRRGPRSQESTTGRNVLFVLQHIISKLKNSYHGDLSCDGGFITLQMLFPAAGVDSRTLLSSYCQSSY